jgi:hypothetical protein
VVPPCLTTPRRQSFWDVRLTFYARRSKDADCGGGPLDETHSDVSPLGNGRVPATPPTPASSARRAHDGSGSGSGSGVIFGALARSGRTTPGLSVRASVAYSFLQRVLSIEKRSGTCGRPAKTALRRAAQTSARRDSSGDATYSFAVCHVSARLSSDTACLAPTRPESLREEGHRWRIEAANRPRARRPERSH